MSNAFGPPGQFGPPPPAGPPGPPPGAPFPPPPPPDDGSRRGVIIAIVAVLVLFALPIGGSVYFISAADDDSSNSSSSTGGSSGGDTGGTDGGGGSSTSGGTDGTFSPSPTPDPTASAFDAIKAGDCLTVWDTGYGGDTIKWSSEVPPEPVPSCDDEDALVHVSQVTDSPVDCRTGTGRSYWSYRSQADGRERVLCLDRVYHKYYCLLGKQEGKGRNARISIGSMTAVDCEAEKVPVPYNQIMHITGVYDAPPGATADNCVQGAGDTRLYWAWKVDGGETLLCTTIYQG